MCVCMCVCVYVCVCVLCLSCDCTIISCFQYSHPETLVRSHICLTIIIEELR